jgi:hypothetical protein
LIIVGVGVSAREKRVPILPAYLIELIDMCNVVPSAQNQ